MGAVGQPATGDRRYDRDGRMWVFDADPRLGGCWRHDHLGGTLLRDSTALQGEFGPLSADDEAGGGRDVG